MLKPRRFLLANLPIDSLKPQDIVPHLMFLVSEKREKPAVVTYLNIHNFNLAIKDERYRKTLQKADLVYADGWGLVLGAKVMNFNLPARMTAKDFFDEFCQLAVNRKKTIYLLGGRREVIIKTKQALTEKFPELKIKGYHQGFFSPKEEEVIFKEIKELEPDFLIIGLGSPRQEEWLADNISKLKIKSAWCVGGLFDFISETKPVCPRWLGNLGGEWLFRLLTEPGRLWKRYLIGVPRFYLTIAKLKLESL